MPTAHCFSSAATFALLLSLAGSAAGAQQVELRPCTPEMVMAKKDAWTAPAKEAANDLNDPVIARIAQMGKPLLDTYDPRGTHPSWYPWTFSGTAGTTKPSAYQFVAMFMYYYCGRPPFPMARSTETGIWFYVNANHFSWFFDDIETSIWSVAAGEQVHVLTRKAGELHGYQTYEGLHNRRSNVGTFYSRTLLLSRAGESPFVPVTRRELLTGMTSWLEKTKAKQMAGIRASARIRPDSEQQRSKQIGLESIDRNIRASNRDAHKARFLANWKTDQQMLDSNVMMVGRYYDDRLTKTRKLMASLSDAELQRPALVGNQAPDNFDSFPTEEDGGRMLVRENSGYFHPGLPRHARQFLVVYWQWDSTQVGRDVRDQVESKLDFKALQAMIDR
jgi:hypothetical protein